MEKKFLEDKIKKAHLKFPNIIEKRFDLNIKFLLLFRFLFHAMASLSCFPIAIRINDLMNLSSELTGKGRDKQQ